MSLCIIYLNKYPVLQRFRLSYFVSTLGDLSPQNVWRQSHDHQFTARQIAYRVFNLKIISPYFKNAIGSPLQRWR
jgi:hypothetical protein